MAATQQAPGRYGNPKHAHVKFGTHDQILNQILQTISLTWSYSDSSQNVSLIPLHWAVIMGRVLTEPGKKMPLHSIG